MDKRSGGRLVCRASFAGRIGRLDLRTQGRVERAVFAPDTWSLYAVRAIARREPLKVYSCVVCPEFTLFRARVDEQADAGNDSFSAPTPGPLALRTLDASDYRHRTKLVLEKVPFFLLAVASSIVTFLVQSKGEPFRQFCLWSIALKTLLCPTSLRSAKQSGPRIYRSSTLIPVIGHCGKPLARAC